MKTFIYKTVGDCAIKADVYRTETTKIRPAIIFIHGGALIGGNRQGSPIIIDMLVNAGYTVISIDYRLAPETKLKEILEDICDAYQWVGTEGPALFNIDPNHIGIVGNSAGGYLTLMCGLILKPLPKVLVSMYGYGDIVGKWYTEPSLFYCKQSLVSEAIARAAVGTKPVSQPSLPNNRRLFYLFCRQQGLWPQEVTGYNPKTEPEAFTPYCPIQNITNSYPPTLLLHGDDDTDVPCEQSEIMAKKLEEKGAKHRLIKLSDKGHNFEESGWDDPVIAHALNSILNFLDQYLSCNLKNKDKHKNK